MVRTEFETIRQMVDMNLSVIRIKLDDLDAAWRMPIEEMVNYSALKYRASCFNAAPCR